MNIIGLPAALTVDAVLWSAGTLLGLFSAILAYAGLVSAWITVAIRTFHGSVIRGTLLMPPTVA
jgi:hypothetical protein